MTLPAAPAVKKLESISPSIYEAMLKCKARAAWLVGGKQSVLPAHPRGLLGTAFHAVLEAARSGALATGAGGDRRRRAEALFDDKMRTLFDAAHPLLHAKFEAADRVPFYHLFRARAARMADENAAKAAAPQTRAAAQSGAVETRLSSRDGRISGRPDYIDRADRTVLDYKTGGIDQPPEISESESRQLKLYVFLATENSIDVQKAAVVRADGRRIEFAVSPGEAREEAARAFNLLDEYNKFADKPFVDAASPSQKNCRFCPCIPFCEAFWQAAQHAWASECGVHLEGEVRAITGTDLMSIDLALLRGTGGGGEGVLTRLSSLWLTYAEPLPAIGQIVRVTEASYVPETASPAIFRADRVATVVWRTASSTR